MIAKNETISYTQVGHFSWRKNGEWMSEPDHKGEPLSIEIKQQIEDLARTLNLSPEDTQQAIREGEIAARIEVDPEFAATQTINGLKSESRSTLSPLACVARKLSLIGMIQRGEITAYVDKNTGKDILPELQRRLSDVKINS